MGKKKRIVESMDMDSFNMTPMIDIVFQLIIFFMLATEMTRASIEQLTLPKANAIEDKLRIDDQTVVMNIKSKGEIVWNRQQMGTQQLVDFFKQLTTDKGSNYSLNIRVARDANWEHVQRVLAIAVKQGNARSIMVSAEADKNK